MSAGDLLAELRVRNLEPVEDVRSCVLAVSRIPYGRPDELSPRGVLAGWRGTCSTKHLLLAELLPQLDAPARVDLRHRVHSLTPELAHELWGPGVAAVVPRGGLVDVHTYAIVAAGDRAVRVDATFPVAGWDGASDMVLACGPGEDIDAGPDPLASKRSLVAAHCDAALRERLIAALSGR